VIQEPSISPEADPNSKAIIIIIIIIISNSSMVTSTVEFSGYVEQPSASIYYRHYLH